MLGFALHRRHARDRRNRILEFSRRIGGAASLAAVTILIGRPTARTGTTNEAIRQEHRLARIIGLLDGAPLDMAGVT